MTTSRKLKSLLTIIGLMVIMAPAALAADPGLTYPIGTGPGTDDKKGSLLFYNIYTSASANPIRQNTRINITNTSDTSPAFVHLFFVDGGLCSPADRFICLTPLQTVSLLASEQDPGVTGYIIANSVNFDGTPRQFNHLIGDAFVKFEAGHFAWLNAEAYAKLDNNNVISSDGTLARLDFNGGPFGYELAARVLAVDSIPARADGNDTLLILNRVGGNLLTGTGNTIGAVFGILYDDAEEPFSFTFVTGCHFRSILSNNFPRVAPRFEVVIPAGQTGWMKLWVSGADVSLSGSVINFNPNTGVVAGAFNGGHNLHKLKLNAAAQIIVPIFPIGC